MNEVCRTGNQSEPISEVRMAVPPISDEIDEIVEDAICHLMDEGMTAMARAVRLVHTLHLANMARK